MPKVKILKSVPKDSLVGMSFGAFDYSDAFYVVLRNEKHFSIDRMFSCFMSFSPTWLKALVKFRNFIVSFVGLKTGDLAVEKVPDNYLKGSRLGVFNIIDRNQNEIVFGENDKHLNFESSLFLRNENGITILFSITVVKYNNFTGRFYFFFVRPFHRIIVSYSLKRLAKIVDKY